LFAGLVATLTIGVSSSIAQSWNIAETTERITGKAYDTTGTAALLIVEDQLHYVDWDVNQHVDPIDCGPVKQIYRSPVPWHAGDKKTFFRNGGSPTNAEVTITLSVDAAVYSLDRSNEQVLFVGIVRSYEVVSNGDTVIYEVFEPMGVPVDKLDAKERFSLLTGGGSALSTSGGTTPPSCADICKNNYNTEMANAKDTYYTNLKANCALLAVPGGAVTGCAIGVAVCGWLLPPASTIACCAGGAIITTALAGGACVAAETEAYQSALRNAKRNYENCMLNCGIVIVEH
jgi:hypothetical protein